MREPPAYERDPYCRELDVDVLACGEDRGRPYALLSDTILYPEGGGQPADRGFLDGVAVLDVRRHEGETRHFLGGVISPGAVRLRLRLDWNRRFDHMQQHTAQHLLSAVAATLGGWQTMSFHLGAHRCDIELDAETPAGCRLAELEEAVAEQVRAALPVTSRRVAPEELEGLGVRSRGLPAGHTGPVRLVEIEGVDLNTCGGTHLGSTSEIEVVKLLGAEPMRGGTRLHWVAGRRARGLLDEHERRTAALRALLDTAADELVEAVGSRLQRLRDVDRQVSVLERTLAEALAARLAADPEPVTDLHLEPGDAGLLQQVARRLSALAPAQRSLLTASGPAGHFFVVVAASGSGPDLATAGPAVAELLEGRGGGRDGLFQGRAGSLARRAEALAVVRGTRST